MPRCDDAGQEVARKPAGCAEGATAGQEVLRRMLAAQPGGPEEPLLSEEVLGFWTEHSGRAALSSGLAAPGATKSDRDDLGRRSPEGADACARTRRAVAT